MTASQDITPELDGGVIKTVKVPGPDPNDKPWRGDNVWVHYTGTLEDGSKFDSSIDRGERFMFCLGKAEVIKGWDIGVATMAKGEISVFKISPEYAYGPMGKPPQIPENATLIFEIELCQFDGEDITKTRDGGIKKRIKEGGEGFDHPNDGGSVTVDLVGSYEGRVFETRNNLTFTLGEGGDLGIPRGVELTLEKMKKKERVEVRLAPKYGFGAAGNPQLNIPPNANISYQIDLENFERAKESWQMDAEAKVEYARNFKDRGTDFFKQEKFDLAANKYKKIIEFLEHELSLKGDIEEERKTLLLAGRLNLTMCMLKQNEWIDARNLCSKILEERIDVPKAYFRRGEAHLHLKDYDLALADFQRVLQLEPDNRAARNKIAVCNQEIKTQRSRDRKIFANMFDKFARIDSKKGDNRQNESRIEIGEWTTSAEKGDVLSVQGDVKMDVDLNKAIEEDEESH